MRLLQWVAVAVFGATLATSCASSRPGSGSDPLPLRPLIYVCGNVSSSEGDPSRIDARALADRNYDLEIMHVDGPGGGRGYCTAPAYDIGEGATLIELGAGDYAMLAKAQDRSSPYAFPLRGRVAVEKGRCYLPAMACDGAKPDAAVCRLLLNPTACATRLLPKRVVLRGSMDC